MGASVLKYCLLFIPAILLISCDVKINEENVIPDNSVVENDLITVNGGITIGDNCKVYGSVTSVNGSVSTGNACKIDASVTTVNGTIYFGNENRIDGDITTVNGRIELAPKCEVEGDIENVNGGITLNQTHTTGDVSTHLGNIVIRDGSKVRGTVSILDSQNDSPKRQVVTIEVTGNSIVYGDVINENSAVDVIIYIEHGSEVKGRLIDIEKIENADAIDDL